MLVNEKHNTNICLFGKNQNHWFIHIYVHADKSTTRPPANYVADQLSYETSYSNPLTNDPY